MNNTRDNELLKRFGNHLKSLRGSKDLSLREFAAEINVEWSHIHRIENGEVNPSLTMLKRLAEGLGITLAELVDISSASGRTKSKK